MSPSEVPAAKFECTPAASKIYHDGINSATARLTRAAIAVKKLEPLLGGAMTPEVATLWASLQIAVGLRSAPALRRVPTMIGCSCTMDGGPVFEDCELCAGTGWVAAP